MNTYQTTLASFLLSITLAPCAFTAAPNALSLELQATAEAGDAEAQFQIARAYLRGEGVTKDPNQAFALMKKAAEQGHSEALGGMGYFYATGTVVQEDDAAAVEWFRKGADKGSAKARLNLGLAVAKGTGTTRDEAEGLRLIDAAAEAGLADAFYAQGETYHWGQFGRSIDYKKARAAFQKSADQGHAAAQNNLGVIHREGLETQKDEQAALSWFRKAAEQGHAKAQSNLGHQLGANNPDRTKRLEALKWLLLAVDQKEITAVKTMEELEPSLPKEDLAEARQAADDFLGIKVSVKS